MCVCVWGGGGGGGGGCKTDHWSPQYNAGTYHRTPGRPHTVQCWYLPPTPQRLIVPTSGPQADHHDGEQGEVEGHMGADTAVVNADVQQRHKQQRDGEHHIAKCDPCVDGEVLNSGHVERGREQGRDEVGHWDGLRDLGKVALVEEDEIVCSCNIAGPGEEEPGTRHQHAEVDQVEAVLGLHVTDRVSCMSVTMCTTTPAVLTQFQEHCAF